MSKVIVFLSNCKFSVRIGQSYIMKDGPNSYEGNRHIEKAISLLTNKLGKNHPKVTEASKILEDIQAELLAKEEEKSAKQSQKLKQKEDFEKLLNEASSGLRSQQKPAINTTSIFGKSEYLLY